MEWVVTTGRTVAEAVESALDQLGVHEDEADIVVVQEPQKGLFGRLRAEAQIRARVRPTAPRPKLDRRERRRSERRGSDGDRARGRAKPGRDGRAKAEGPVERRRADGEVSGAGAEDDGAGASLAVARADEANVPLTRASRSASRRRRSGRTAKGANVVSESTESTEAPRVAGPDIDGQRQAVEGFLSELLTAFGRPDATITVRVADDDDEAIEAAIDGPELGLLVGQKGVTLQAVQELVRSMVQRRFVGQAHARVRLDVAGYRARRKVALERFARDVAEAVKSSGVSKALDPMGPADRKIVHDTVNEMDGVVTASEGEDAARRVVIRPG